MSSSNYWTVTGRGDNEYTLQFRSKYEVTAFLYGLLAKIENCDWGNGICFDIEDDKIEVKSPNGVTYTCNGWHWSWSEESERELMMPDGESFYSKASRFV